MRYASLFILVGAAVLVACMNGSDVQHQSGNPILGTDPGGRSEWAKAGLSVDLPEVHIEMLPYQPVHVRSLDAYELELRLTYPEASPLDRLLRLERISDSLGDGVSLSLCKPDGDLVCEITQIWGITGDGALRYFVAEKTLQDSLTLHMITAGADVTECYTLNGAGIELTYTRGTLSEDTARVAFSTFYEETLPSTQRTLEENREGAAMIGLIGDPEFADWLQSAVLPPAHDYTLDKAACNAECICGLASICAALKCSFGGGMLNFMCDACFGTSIACAIAAVVTNWYAS